MFASKTPRDLNRDPVPYRIWTGPWFGTRTSRPIPGMTEHDPRPEFDHVQHNAPNPVLVAFRDDKNSGPVGYVVDGRRPSRLEHWLMQIAPLDRTAVAIGTGTQPSVAQIDHARRVLTRLANLEGFAS